MDYLWVRSADALAIRGAVAIILGLLALLLPGPTFLVLTIAFGTFAMIDGLLALVALFDRNRTMSRGWLALEAAAGILVGILALFRPGITALSLVYLIGAWAIVTGIFKIATAIRLRKRIQREWLLVLSGIVSIIFGGILALSPLPGIMGLMWALGIFGLVFGTMLVVAAFRLRRLDDIAEHRRAA